MLSPLEEIKNRIDLVEYLRPYVGKLSTSGKSLRGLCPFHQEKTPSFFISPEKQVWYCFGCQKGGDLLRFVMEKERMEFAEALRFLAEKAGVRLEKQDPKLLNLKAKVYEVLKQSQKFYHYYLGKSKIVQDYLSGRGLKTETADFFALGFAPSGWRNLYQYLRKFGFQDNEILQSGMVIKGQMRDGGQGFFDRFRNRIMFPVFDPNNRVIGFSGRILPPPVGEVANQVYVIKENKVEEAKYINTPETIVYQKSHHFYGFAQTQTEIRQKEQAILVEGNLDVLMGWQVGLKNIIAASGTGLSEFQLKTLSRFCKSLVLNFDMDKAGEQATDRSIALASQAGFEISVLPLPDGKDLADFAKDHPEQAGSLLERSRKIMDYYFDKAFLGQDLTQIETKKKALVYLLPRIKFLKNPAEQSQSLAKLSSVIKVPEKMIYEEFAQTKSLLEVSRDTDEEKNLETSPIFLKSRWERLGERLLALAIRFEELIPKLAGFENYFPFRFKELAGLLVSGKKEEIEQEDLNYFYLLGDYELALLPENFSLPEHFERSLGELRQLKLRANINDISLAIKEAELSGNLERVGFLTTELKKNIEEFNQVAVYGKINQ